ncbi:MAG: alpha/beta hydrolase [Gammaproteobacteria bacterium]|jgi:fermentation-respiration switch protein FrsA (DUF1100 family)|nr:alpha/beta hydrolase [Gammaproteobacteria bacterium]
MLTLIWLLGSGVLLYGVAAAIFWLRQPQLLYRPLQRAATAGHDHDLGYGASEDVWLRAGDGVRLHGLYFDHPDPAGTVLFCHGNTSDVSRCRGIAAMYLRLGYAVLLFDYRGYGRSEGTPTEAGTYLDVTAAWEYLLRERGLVPGDIVVAGRSLGSAIAVWLAAWSRPRALVLESAFTSLPDISARRYRWLPARLLTRFRYAVAEHVVRLRCPLLIVHSREDELVPFSHAQRLHALAPDPKELLAIAGPHRDEFRADCRQYEDGIAAFLDRHRQGLSAQRRRDTDP